MNIFFWVFPIDGNNTEKKRKKKSWCKLDGLLPKLCCEKKKRNCIVMEEIVLQERVRKAENYIARLDCIVT